jgi:hypothetical protein
MKFLSGLLQFLLGIVVAMTAVIAWTIISQNWEAWLSILGG